jgi:aldehyde dehydrogenase (NAD+)
MTKTFEKFYINGKWVKPIGPPAHLNIINPATEEPCGRIALGSREDVAQAVQAAGAAFDAWSQTSFESRLTILAKIAEGIKDRYEELTEVITKEMGAPLWLAQKAQVAAGLAHFVMAAEVLKKFQFESQMGSTRIVREPIGVCGFITPWNWPLNQIACKVAPALAAGCTIILKPSEIAPLNACILTEIIHDAGVPAGVINLVNGDGPTVGAALAAHGAVDMVSFTGSTRAGILVAKTAAESVKRVTQELGGKSANIILDDTNLEQAVSGGVQRCFTNSGQSCNAPTRMLVPAAWHDEAVAIAETAARQVRVGDPMDPETTIGPVVSQTQYDRIQTLLKQGIAEDAQMVIGGPGRPEHLDIGYYVRPTVFAGVDNAMTIAREEIFGPVLCILPYRDEDEAVRIANDSPYGLSGYVSSDDPQRARRVAARLRTGNVHLNGAGADFQAPFGGYKQSGNGREWGEHGLAEFLETKAIMGWGG